MNIEYHKVRTKHLALSETLHGKGSFIQFTEWVNGDGWDVQMETSLGKQQFSVDYDLMDSLIHLHTARTPLESNT